MTADHKKAIISFYGQKWYGRNESADSVEENYL